MDHLGRFEQGLGTEYEVLRVSFKPYPCCRWIHSTVDAIRDLVRAHPIRPDGVQTVTVRSIEPLKKWFDSPRPTSMVDAEFSVPHAVAMAVLERPRSQWWHDENRRDPTVLDFMDRVVVEIDRDAHAEFADKRDSAVVPTTVRIATARQMYEQARRACHGGPLDPMTGDEIREKYPELVTPVLTEPKALAVLETIENLDHLKAVPQLARCLRTPDQ
jgi:2-methylcitrate dehydratase PrpD